MSKKFPNGFSCWQETHYEVVSEITVALLNISSGTNAHKIQEAQGQGGLWEAAEDWTDEFEKMNKGREWDGEFYDEINEFMNKKIYEDE